MSRSAAAIQTGIAMLFKLVLQLIGSVVLVCVLLLAAAAAACGSF
jgi:hypothetical protein